VSFILREPFVTCLKDTSSSQDALRSIVISQRLLGTREIAIFHHTGCGMATFTTQQLREIVKNDAAPEVASEIAQVVDKTDFLEFSDLEESVKSDVQFVKENPLVLKETVVTGWIYDVHDGKVSRFSGVLVQM
jgi:carbonic anhydrase